MSDFKFWDAAIAFAVDERQTKRKILTFRVMPFSAIGLGTKIDGLWHFPFSYRSNFPVSEHFPASSAAAARRLILRLHLIEKRRSHGLIRYSVEIIWRRFLKTGSSRSST